MMGSYATALMTTTTFTPSAPPRRPLCPGPDRGPDYVCDTESEGEGEEVRRGERVPSPVPLVRQEGGLVPLPVVATPAEPTPDPLPVPLVPPPAEPTPDPLRVDLRTTDPSLPPLTLAQRKELAFLAEKHRVELANERNHILLRRQENLHLNEVLSTQAQLLEKCLALSEKLRDMRGELTPSEGLRETLRILEDSVGMVTRVMGELREAPAVNRYLKERTEWLQLSLELTEALNRLSPLVVPTVTALRSENVGEGGGVVAAVTSTTAPRRQKRKATYVPSDTESDSESDSESESVSEADLTRPPPVRKAAKKAARDCKRMLRGGRGKK